MVTDGVSQEYFTRTLATDDGGYEETTTMRIEVPSQEGNSLPVINSISHTPEYPVVGDDITIHIDATDADNDTLYFWESIIGWGDNSDDKLGSSATYSPEYLEGYLGVDEPSFTSSEAGNFRFNFGVEDFKEATYAPYIVYVFCQVDEDCHLVDRCGENKATDYWTLYKKDYTLATCEVDPVNPQVRKCIIPNPPGPTIEEEYCPYGCQRNGPVAPDHCVVDAQCEFEQDGAACQYCKHDPSQTRPLCKPSTCYLGECNVVPCVDDNDCPLTQNPVPVDGHVYCGGPYRIGGKFTKQHCTGSCEDYNATGLTIECPYGCVPTGPGFAYCRPRHEQCLGKLDGEICNYCTMEQGDTEPTCTESICKSEQCLLPDPLKEGMIFQMTFNDGSATDTVNGNNGILIGNPTWLETGGVSGSGAFEFDGVDDVIEVASAPILESMTDITILAWINAATTQPDTWNTFVRRDTDSLTGRTLYDMDLKDGYLRLTFMGKSSGQYTAGTNTSGTDLRDANWHHVAIVRDDTNTDRAYGYVDGVLEIDVYDKAIGSFDGTDTPLLIGQWNLDRVNPLNRRLNGLIDEIRIYDRALNQTTLQAIYGQGPDMD
jgi:hypothetical protein